MIWEDIEKLPPIVGTTIVCRFLGVSKPTLMDMVRRGDFPPPLPTGTRAMKWSRDDLALFHPRRANCAELKQEDPEDIIATREKVARELAEELAPLFKMMGNLINRYGGLNASTR
jgi:predicted DNA-binding transcriptional regulator AlpA